MEEIVLVNYDNIVRDSDSDGAILFDLGEREIWIPRSVIDDIWEEYKEVGVFFWFAKKERLV